MTNITEMRYKADITAGALKLPESRLIADLLLRQVDAEGWKDAILTNNVLQARNPATARRLTRLIRNRLETMGPDLWKLVRDGQSTVATQAVFAAAVTAGKNDLYASFMLRNQKLAMRGGQIGMITIPNWMFLSSFEQLRLQLFNECHLTSLVHNGRGVWGGDFGSVSFVYVNTPSVGFSGSYLRLFKKQGEIQSGQELEDNLKKRTEFPVFRASVNDFKSIPGNPIAYSISDQLRYAFRNKRILDVTISDGQNITADNEKYVRFLWEVNSPSVGNDRKWRLYSKGGPFQKWFGNLVHIVDWSEAARTEYRRGNSSRIIPEYLWYRRGITWSRVTSSYPSFRLLPETATFDKVGSSVFVKDGTSLEFLMGLLNSNVTTTVLTILNPTLDIQVMNVRDIPISFEMPVDQIACRVSEAIQTTRDDWDNFETSWDFRDQPLLRPGLKGATLEASWRNWEAQSTAAIRRMQELETENNRVFIAAYGLDGELQPEVPEAQITLARAEARRDMAAFLSYAVGCMMGRYSLEAPGLILANAGDTLADYVRITAAKAGKTGKTGARDEGRGASDPNALPLTPNPSPLSLRPRRRRHYPCARWRVVRGRHRGPHPQFPPRHLW